MKKGEKNKTCIFSISLLIILLIIISFSFLTYYKEIYYEKKFTERIPDVPLLKFIDKTVRKCPRVNITGFIAFENLEDQPKNLRQYQIIEDDNVECVLFEGKPKFNLTNLYKMNSIMINKDYDTIELKLIEQDDNIIILESDNNDKYTINRHNNNIHLNDANGQQIKLITRESEFKKFIEKWQNERENNN